MKVGFIGSGNMARAMMQGMLKARLVQPTDVIASAPSESTRETIGALGVVTTADNQEVAQAEIVFLTVKPYLYQTVIAEIAETIRPETVVVTVAPGITLEKLSTWFGKDRPIVRTMPNTPALVGKGVTGYSPNDFVTESQLEQVVALLNSFGLAIAVPEKLIEAVSGVSGSGPAYAYMFIEALAQAGIQSGLPHPQAYQLAAQTVLGAAAMILETNQPPAVLRDQVCSPGGSTIEGVRTLEEKGLRSAVIEGVLAGVNRAKQLGS